jgi:transposase-like protein
MSWGLRWSHLIFRTTRRWSEHPLGLREGATENAEVVRSLLEDLADRSLDSKRRRLFVIDGSLALRKAIDLIFGVETPVQRCRNHKLRNVLGHLPEAQHDQAKSTLKTAFKLDAKEGMAQLEKYATWLERDWPSAASSLREGLDEGVRQSMEPKRTIRLPDAP